MAETIIALGASLESPVSILVTEAAKSKALGKRYKSRAGACSAHDKGFTLIELLIVVAVIMTIAAIAVPSLLGAMNQARIARAVGDIHAIGTDAQGYEMINGAYPPNLTAIGYGSRNDPWGNPYQYLNFSTASGKGKMRKDHFLVPINSFFDLYSMGPDGKSVSPLTAQASQDDIIWANDGDYIGPASDY